jgi:hypothetical protein
MKVKNCENVFPLKIYICKYEMQHASVLIGVRKNLQFNLVSVKKYFSKCLLATFDLVFMIHYQFEEIYISVSLGSHFQRYESSKLF